MVHLIDQFEIKKLVGNGQKAITGLSHLFVHLTVEISFQGSGEMEQVDPPPASVPGRLYANMPKLFTTDDSDDGDDMSHQLDAVVSEESGATTSAEASFPTVIRLKLG